MSSINPPENPPDTPQGRGEDAALAREETIRYIGAMAGELSEIARGADLDLIAYFLEMARLEAQELIKAGRKARTTR